MGGRQGGRGSVMLRAMLCWETSGVACGCCFDTSYLHVVTYTLPHGNVALAVAVEERVCVSDNTRKKYIVHGNVTNMN